MQRSSLFVPILLLAGLVGLTTTPEAGPLEAELRGATLYAKLRGKNIAERAARQIINELELDEDQRERVWTILESYQPRIDELKQSVQESGFRLMDLEPADPGYSEALERLARGSAETVVRLIELTGTLRAELYAVLTPAQKELAREMKTELRKKMVKLIDALDS